jgi:CHAD domain-containing protein
MRSALALFGDSIPSELGQRFREELRWIAGELADARDLDVFLAETLQPILEQTADSREIADLDRVLRCMRVAAYDRSRTALESRRFVRLVLTLGAWLAGRRWRAPGGKSTATALTEPARETAPQLLDRRFDKARVLGAGVRELSPEDAHRLRIELKKLRYACEFLGGLYRPRRARRFVKRVARLQHTLGRLNDQQTVRDLLARALEHRSSDPAGPVTPWAVGFVSGWSSRVALADLRPLEGDWKAFAKLDPFWLAG